MVYLVFTGVLSFLGINLFNASFISCLHALTIFFGPCNNTFMDGRLNGLHRCTRHTIRHFFIYSNSNVFHDTIEIKVFAQVCKLDLSSLMEAIIFLIKEFFSNSFLVI